MTDPSPAAVTHDVVDDVAVVRVDDGKANAYSHDLIDALHGALDDAERDARAVALLGRPGRFSAGFDLATMRSGTDEARMLLQAGGDLCLRLYRFPMPVVLGCTGHALALGAILLLAGDVRVGAAGDFKLGMNEVAIGMPVPRFAVRLAEDRLSNRYRTAAVNLAAVLGPDEARDAGYLDVVVPPDDVEPTVLARAAELAAGLQPDAFRATRAYLRAERADHAAAGLAADVGTFVISEP
jgi:enoyl-CoA hydratase